MAELPELVAKAFAVAAFGGAGLAFDLVEADVLADLRRRLNYVRAGEGIVVGVDEFLIEAAWLRSADIAAHVADHVFMQVAHETLDNHEGFVSDGRSDGFLEVPAIEQGLGGGEDVGVEHVAGIASTLDVVGGARKGLDNLFDFSGDADQHRVGLLESPHEVGPLSEVDGVDACGLARNPSVLEDGSEVLGQLAERPVRYIVNRLVFQLVGDGEGEFEVVENPGIEVRSVRKGMVDDVVLRSDEAGEDILVDPLDRIPIRDETEAPRWRAHEAVSLAGCRLLRADARSRVTAVSSMASKSVLQSFIFWVFASCRRNELAMALPSGTGTAFPICMY